MYQVYKYKGLQSMESDNQEIIKNLAIISLFVSEWSHKLFEKKFSDKFIKVISISEM